MHNVQHNINSANLVHARQQPKETQNNKDSIALHPQVANALALRTQVILEPGTVSNLTYALIRYPHLYKIYGIYIRSISTAYVYTRIFYEFC